MPLAETSSRIGLIGCGGRGTGAAENALRADKNCKLVALGDAFPDRIERSLGVLEKSMGDKLFAEKINVPAERKFSGFDAYKHVSTRWTWCCSARRRAFGRRICRRPSRPASTFFAKSPWLWMALECCP